MSGVDSDSDEFVSADEYSDHEELSSNPNQESPKSKENDAPNIPNTVTQASRTDEPISDENSLEESPSFQVSDASFEIDEDNQARSYRKRPERRRKSSPPLSTESELNPIIDIVKKSDLKPIIDVVKVARPEAIVSNLTNQLTSNISRGLATFQGTSSSLKELVSNLTGDFSDREGAKFVYDDERTRTFDEGIEESNEISNEEANGLSEVHEEAANLPEEPITLPESTAEETYNPHLEESPMTSSITEEILKLSEAFEKLKQNRLSEEAEVNQTEVVRDEEEILEIGPSQDEAIERTRALGSKETVNEQIETGGWDEWNDEENEPLAKTEEEIPISDKVDLVESARTAAISMVKEIEESIGRFNFDEVPQPAKIDKAEETEKDGWDDWPEDNEEMKESLGPTIIKEELSKINEGAKIVDGTEDVEKIEDKADEEEEHGWDDWGDDAEEEVIKEEQAAEEDDGWGDWGDEHMAEAEVPEKPKPKSEQLAPTFSAKQAEPEWGGWESFGEKKDSQWGIGGWGINSLLSKATAVTSNLSAVTQGLSNVIETGLGVPDPETMARIHAEEQKTLKESGIEVEDRESSPFPFSNIVSGVGKIVEVAKVQEIGSRVLSGGLDTLETIGKKTMEVLQDGDPGLKKKKALLMGKGKMLSDVLKEARDRAIAEEKQAGLQAALKRCHFETLFDDFQGLVHLEALEMLSRQCELRLEQVQQGLSAGKLRELRDTMEEITQLCEIDDDFDSGEVDDFREAVTEAALPLGQELSVVKILELHDRMTAWLSKAESLEPTAVYDYAITILAELTAAVTMQFHKSGELLVLKERRKTVEEADSLLQLSSTICSELTSTSGKIGELLQKFDHATVELLTNNLRVETENAVAYIKQAFTLLIPVLQLGAT